MSNKTALALVIVGGAYGYLIHKRVKALEEISELHKEFAVNQVKLNDSLIKESETKHAKAKTKRGRKPKTESE